MDEIFEEERPIIINIKDGGHLVIVSADGWRSSSGSENMKGREVLSCAS